MISTERAEQILKIFQCEPRDIVKFVVDRKLTNKELEFLLEHGDGNEEVKSRIKGEIDRRRASIGTWLLETADGEAVFTDLGGRFSLNKNAAFCYAAEFVEDQHPDDDKEKWREHAAEQMGVDLKLVPGPRWTADQLYG
jgi:hypothetical protein